MDEEGGQKKAGKSENLTREREKILRRVCALYVEPILVLGKGNFW